MAREIFYYNTTRNIITSFGSLFDEISIINDHNEEIKVPLTYSPKEKFLEYISRDPLNGDNVINSTMPRLAFELESINFAPERHTNPMNKISYKKRDTENFMYNRIPYDFNFALHLASKKFEESLKIVEQIIPFFTPELNISVKDKDNFDIITDMPVVLTSSSYTIDYEGSFDNKRTIMWTLQFTLKGFLYSNTRESKIIKKATTVLSQPELDKKYTTYIHEVIPNSANKEDPHSILSTVEEFI